MFFFRPLPALSMLFLALVLVVSPTPAADAASWSCSEFSTRYSVALGQGDIGAASKAQKDLSACQSTGTGAAVASSISACKVWLDASVDALSRGDSNSSSIYKSTYNDCVSNTSSRLGNNNPGGGSGGGGSDKGCYAAPQSPNLEVRYVREGIWLTIKANLGGEKTNTIDYSYTFWDSTRNQWENWTPRLGESRPTISRVFKRPTLGHTFFAFEAVASNRCGSSSIAKLGNGTGISSFGVAAKDRFTQNITFIYSDYLSGKEVGYGTYFSQIGKSESQMRCDNPSEYEGLDCEGETTFEWDLPTTPAIKSLTPSTCVAKNARVTTKATKGVCKLQVRTRGDFYSEASTSTITLKIVAMKTVDVWCSSGSYPNYKYLPFRGVSAAKLKNFKCPSGSRIDEVFHKY